jgi:hypothetical protein
LAVKRSPSGSGGVPGAKSKTHLMFWQSSRHSDFAFVSTPCTHSSTEDSSVLRFQHVFYSTSTSVRQVNHQTKLIQLVVLVRSLSMYIACVIASRLVRDDIAPSFFSSDPEWSLRQDICQTDVPIVFLPPSLSHCQCQLSVIVDPICTFIQQLMNICTIREAHFRIRQCAAEPSVVLVTH